MKGLKMKFTQKDSDECEIKYFKLAVPVIDDEDDIPNDFPFRQQSEDGDYDTWSITIDLDAKKIIDWPQGVKKNVVMDVGSNGSYWLLDAEKNVIAARIESYVPILLLIQGDHTTIDIDIEADGTVKNLEHPNSSLDDFIENNDEDDEDDDDSED
jgi:hypothetical protein